MMMRMKKGIATNRQMPFYSLCCVGWPGHRLSLHSEWREHFSFVVNVLQVLPTYTATGYRHTYKLDRSNHFTLHPLADLFIPTQTRLLWKHSSHAAITRVNYSLTIPPLYIARYPFIHRGENENAQISKRAKGIRTRALLIASPEFYC